MSEHKLHIAVGKAFDEIITEPYQVKMDAACIEGSDNKKNLPFFLSVNPSNNTEITNVDLMVVNNQMVKLVCEIEESDITPIRTFGKIFTAATAVMCRLNNDTRYDMDKNGIFIQVLSNKELNKEKSKKVLQGKNMEDSINAILKSNCTWIKEYHLIYVDVDDFNPGNNGYLKIQEIFDKFKQDNF